MSSELIKTTAKYQEANEPLKQRPIIQIERPLPNTIKASLVDSGRDNPFRPDGEIYKSADPIVNYYKHGANQSRAQSPTDSQLLLNSNQTNSTQSQSDSKLNQKDKKRKRARRRSTEDAAGGAKRRPCLSRWLCCCCYWCSSDDKNDNAHQPQTKSPAETEKEALGQYKAPPAVDTKTKEFKQTKIVVLKDSDEEPELVGIQQAAEKASSDDQLNQKKGESIHGQTRSKSNRCVIS